MLPATPVGVAGVPGMTGAAVVVVVVAADPELPELPVEIGAIEAAAEQPPARAVPPLPQYQGMPEPSGQVPPKYPANEPTARATVVVVDVVVDVVAVDTVVAIAIVVVVAGLVVTVFVEPAPATAVGIKLIISTTPCLTPESTFLATP